MRKKQISNTAAYVAIKFYGLTLNEKLGRHFPQFVTEYYSRLVRFLPKSLAWYHKALSLPFWRKLFVFVEELFLPGDLMHIICRKYYIQKLTGKALEEGYEQVIILGSGFDHLGSWISHKGVKAFEIDTPFMAKKKKEFLNKNGFLNENLFCCAVDVNQIELAAYLENNPDFDPQKKTLFIAEGFFDYLTLKTTRSLLKDLSHLCADRKLLTTTFSLDELHFFYRFSFTSGVAMVGEAIKLPLDKTEFKKLLSKTGFEVKNVIPYSDMQEDLVRKSGFDLPVLKGFYLIEC